MLHVKLRFAGRSSTFLPLPLAFFDMRDAVRPLVIVVLILLVPIVPFVVLGEGFETQLNDWLTTKESRPEIAAAVVLLLASDMVLPVPSSVVSTMAGAHLGVPYATAVSWLGMMIGSVLGFSLARWFGEPLARRFSGPEDWARLQEVNKRYGPYALAVTRPVPILAEAMVFLLGTTRLAWSLFLPVACLSNFAIALAYSVLGWMSIKYGQLAIALAASIGLPVIATLLARWLLPQGPARDSKPT